MASLVESVRNILEKVNRISNPPPFVVFNTAYELLSFHTDLSVLESMESSFFSGAHGEEGQYSGYDHLQKRPFINVYTLGCSAAVSLRARERRSEAEPTTCRPSCDSLSKCTFEAAALRWFAEEAAHAEGADPSAFSYYKGQGESVTSDDVSVVVSCAWSISTFHKCLAGATDGADQVVQTALRALASHSHASSFQQASHTTSNNKKASTLGMTLTSAVAVLSNVVARIGFEASQCIGEEANVGAAETLSLVRFVARNIVSAVSSSITSAAGSESHGARQAVPLVLRQILIPLLNHYPPEDASTVAQKLIADTSAFVGRHGDVVILAASLFDCILGGAAGGEGGTSAETTSATVKAADSDDCPIRSNDGVWRAIISVLEDTINGNGSEAQRATAQLQASHLLQRIVSQCEDEWGQNKEALKARNKQNTHSGANITTKAQGAKGGKKNAAAERNNNTSTNANYKHNNNDRGSGTVGLEKKPDNSLTSSRADSRSGVEVIHFHPIFSWGKSESYSQAWSEFFLILEALNEYSLHICSQVIAKIPLLLGCTAAIKEEKKDNSEKEEERCYIQPVFVDLLVQKGLRHPNSGVRKAVLGMLWGPELSDDAKDRTDASQRGLALLSDKTLFDVAFTTATDCKLCSEIDKLVANTNFLGTPSRIEEEAPSLTMDPIADRMCRFYRRALALPHFLPDSFSSSSVKATVVSTTPCDKLLMMIRNLNERTARFSVAMGMRVISDVCVHVPSLIPTYPSTVSADIACGHKDRGTDEETVFDALASVHQLALRGRHQMWMEGRTEALLLEAVLGLLKNLDQAIHKTVSNDCGSGEETDADKKGSDLSLKDVSVLVARAWRLIASMGVSTEEDSHDAPALRTQSFVGLAYVRERVLHYLMNEGRQSYVVESCLRRDDLDFDLNSFLRSIKEESDSKTRELALRISVSSKCVVAAEGHSFKLSQLYAGLLRHYTNLSSRTCIADGTVKNLCRLLRCLVSTEGIESFTHTISTDNQLIESAYEGLTVAAKRIIPSVASSEDPWSGMGTLDAIADVTAILLAAQLISHSIALSQRHVCEWMAVLRDGAGSTRSTEQASDTARVGDVAARTVRMTLRMLRAVVVADTLANTNKSDTSRILHGDEDHAKTLTALLANIESPLPLCTDRRAFASLNSETERYQLDLLAFVLNTISAPASSVLLDHAESIASWLIETVNECAPHNLPTLYAVGSRCVATIGSTTLNDENTTIIRGETHKALQTDTLKAMLAHAQDGLRIHAFRCSAIAYGSLAFTIDDEFVIETIRKVLSAENNTGVARMIFFSALALANKVLGALHGQSEASAARVWGLYKPLLLELAIFINTAAVEDEEMVCAFAALEPAFASLPNTVRAKLPPTTRLVTLARALSIVTICEAVKATSSIRSFLLELMVMNVSDRRISHTPCMPNSKAHRSRLRLWQLIHTFAPLIASEDWEVLIPALQEHCMPISNLASVRRPIDLMLMLGYARRPDLLHLMLPYLDDYDMRAQIAGAYTLVAVNTAVAHAGNDEVFSALCPRLLRLGNSYQHLLRIIAHIGTYALLTKRQSLLLAAGRGRLSPEHASTLHYLENAAEVQKFLQKHYDAVVLDVEKEMSASNNYCVQRMDGPHWLHEGIPAATFSRLLYLGREVPCALSIALPLQVQHEQTLLISGSEGLREAIHSQLNLGMIPRAVHLGSDDCVATDQTEDSNSNDKEANMDEFLDYREVAKKLKAEEKELVDKAAAAAEESTRDSEGEGKSASENIQRKVQSWWTSAIYNQLHPRDLAHAGGSRRNLIIVGSLLDNPVNIAGLCRCGDIFAVERVIVPNKKVFEHPHFVAAAKSAELWVPWEEVAPRDLTKYLQMMRLEGYTIVGVEQTADSQSMANFNFPSRAVVVLGAEGTGVPANVLPYLDVCVEIPQFGLIRSLNVHVTGAIAMYEYSVQHMMNATTRDRGIQ